MNAMFSLYRQHAFKSFWTLFYDFLALCSCVLVLFFVGILVSYCPYDPSYDVATSSTPRNWLGHDGALLADLLFQWIGTGAFVVPFLWSYLFFCFVQRMRIQKGLLFFLWGAITLSLFQPLNLKLYPNAVACLVFRWLPVFLVRSALCAGWIGYLIWILKPWKLWKKKEQRQLMIPSTARLKPIKMEMALPSLALLKDYASQAKKKESHLERLQEVLEDFGVKGDVVCVNPGPIVTLYELEPAAGVKSARVISLADDIARSMSALSARVAVIPGKNLIGIELSNVHREMVYLKDLLASTDYNQFSGQLAMALGKDIGGRPVIVDLAKMPHLLVAGTTGSGKSVGINSMILSLLYRLSPHQCKFIMIDPKMLELSVYDHIPHLLTPVVTEPKKAIMVLKWVVQEMENRYRLMSQIGVRHILGYHQKLAQQDPLYRQVQVGFDEESKPILEKQSITLEAMPFITVVVDEMADLMLVAGKELEILVQRLAQMARAAGIHMIMATQRPSVDVITGTIKANFPTRISFQVTSKIDSRTILGEQGAEHLLGQGDMLYMASGGRIMRVHGPFVSDEEIESVVNFLKSRQEPNYVDMAIQEEGFIDQLSSDMSHDLYKQAVDIIKRDRKVSTSYLQRQLQIGYNRAARLIEQMEKEGLISAPNHVGKREILC